MTIKVLPHSLTVCRISDVSDLRLEDSFCFIGLTDEELSLVCETSRVPTRTLAREDGWRAFRICGVLDFGLIGILSRITGILAAEGIGIFAVSTFNTDYILVKEDKLDPALEALGSAGYEIER